MIADAHVDLLMELAYRERRLGEANVFADTWLPLLERGGVGLQVCPIYVDVAVQPEGSLREALSMVASFHRALGENGGRVVQVSSAADLDAVESGERIGLMLSLEGVECFGVETWPAEVFHALGVRMAGLTWNRRNAFSDGAAEDGGSLSRLGRELVDRLVVARRDLRPRARVARRVRGDPRARRRRAGPLLARRLPSASTTRRATSTTTSFARSPMRTASSASCSTPSRSGPSAARSTAWSTTSSMPSR